MHHSISTLMEYFKKLRRKYFCRNRNSGACGETSSQVSDDVESFVEVNVLRTDLNRTKGFSSNTIRTSKYTPFSAFPLSLFSQFYKVSNVYFLLVVAIALIPDASPISPLTAVIPFTVVLGVGILKDIWMDLKLQRADKNANMTEVSVLRNGEFVGIPSCDVYPGDVILCRVGEEVRMDCVVLSTSLPEGVLYIETTNLDGESNAKIRRAKPETVDRLDTVEAIEELALSGDSVFIKSGAKAYSFSAQNAASLSRKISSAGELSRSNWERDKMCSFSLPSISTNGIVITGSAPNADLSNWMGKLRFPTGEVVALDINQFLPSGCVIRNTEWILAVAMYTGKDTKISRNYHARKRKVAMLSRKLNHLNGFIFLLFQCFVILLSGLGVWFRNETLKAHAEKTTYSAWYMQYDLLRHGNLFFFWRYLTNFVIFSYLIPVSLYVTLEFNKGIQLTMMAADLRMSSSDKISGERRFTKPKTSDSTAELAHVRYIFTDKTGTLTENLMTYVGGYLNGIVHDEVTTPGGVGKRLYHELLRRCMTIREAREQTLGVLELLNREILTGRRRAPRLTDYGDPMEDAKGKREETEVPEERRKEPICPPFLSPNALSMEGPAERSLCISSLGVGEAHPVNTTALLSSPADNLFSFTGAEIQELHATERRTNPFFHCRPRSLMDTISERELESHAAFRYLRCLSLCHSILCFEVKADEVQNEDTNEVKTEGVGEGEMGAINKDDREGVTYADKNYKPLIERVETPVSFALSLQSTNISSVKPRSSSRSPQLSPSVWPGLDSAGGDRGCSETNGNLGAVRAGGRGGVLSFTKVGSSPTTFNSLKSPAQKDGEKFNPVLESSRGHLRMTSVMDVAQAEAGGGFVLPSPCCGSMARIGVHEHHCSMSLYHHVIHSRRETLTSMHGRQVVREESLLSSFIDRTKIYEGQSLDEVALVNAARENGFSLLSRSNRFITVKMLDANRCYQIIAENAFTPERKLMSILLKRCPLEKAMALENKMIIRHYHRARRRNNEINSNNMLFPKEEKKRKRLFTRWLKKGVRNEYNINDRRDRQHYSPFGSKDGLGGGACLANTISLNEQNDSPCNSHHSYSLLESNDNPVICSSAAGGSENDSRSSSLSNLSRSPHSGTDGELERTHPKLNWEGDATGENRKSDIDSQLHRSTAPGEKLARKKKRIKNAKDSTKPSGNDGKQPPKRKTVNDTTAYSEDNKSELEINDWEEDAENSNEEESGLPPYLLVVKGADSSVFNILNQNSPENQSVLKPLTESLNCAAREGLRTLVLGQRYVTEEEVREWLPKWEAAASSMTDRQEKLSEACKLIEKDIELVGSTSVEDKLQDEVPETLQFFRDASIVVWMLTGDKRETAVRIAATSGLAVNDGEDFIAHLDADNEITHAVSTTGEAEPKGGQESFGRREARNKLSVELLGSHSSDPRLIKGLREEDGHLFHSFKREPYLLRKKGWRGDSSAYFAPSPQPEEGEACINTMTSEWLHSLQESGDEREIRVRRQLAEALRLIAVKGVTFDKPVVLLVVDGPTLDVIFSHPELRKAFLEVSTMCSSAVCCRMTPAHKAKIVQMFKTKSSHVLLAIGDGANDVSMIQESHVGVGVMGLEGSQAEMCSDYAIPKFRFLKRLLMVHGRLSFYRDAHCILFCVYKSVLLVSGLGLYNIFNGYSGEILINSWLLAFFNLFFTSFQPFLIGIFDKDVEDELTETVPKIYPAISREKMFFSIPYVAKWMIDGLVEGIFLFLIMSFCIAYANVLFSFHCAGLLEYGAAFYTAIIIVANIRVFTFLGNYNILSVGAAIFFIGILILVQLVFCTFHYFLGPNEAVFVALEIYGSPVFFLFLLAGMGASFLFTVTSGMYIQRFAPWLNAPFAVQAARKSLYTADFQDNLQINKIEYIRRVAYEKEYENLRSGASRF